MDEIIKSKTSISRGLDAIFTAHHDTKNKIFISDIVLSPFQPRKNFNEAALIELSDSIKQHGILQPLIVRQVEQHMNY